MYSFNKCFLVGLLTCFHELFCDGLQKGINPAKTVGKSESVNYDLLRHNIPFRQSQKKFDKQYKLSLTSSSPAVLDSIINFHANLLVQGREVTNKTLFIYSWWNSANEHLLSTEANYESDIDEKSFYSRFINPSIYLMRVSVYKKAPRIEVAHGSVYFNLTEHLNGRLNINQSLKYKKHKFVFATKKPISLSSFITDVFEDSYMFVYIWYANSTFMGWNQTGNVIYPGSNISGDLNITVHVKAFHTEQFLYINKQGVYTQIIELKNEINITKITGTGQVKEGEPVTVNVTFNGSPPAHICWHLLDVNESTIINCTTMNFGNKFSISLPSKDIKHEGTYHLNITIDNDVSKVQTQASFTVVVDKGHNPSRLLAIPITFCVLGVVVTISAVVYAAKAVRKKSHPTEVADFNFHPHIRTRSKLSIIVKNLVSQFIETGEYDSRRPVKRRFTYGSFEDSESTEEDCLLKTIP